MEKKRLRDLERAKKKATEDEIERKRLAEEVRLRKIQELQEAWDSVQYSLLNLKQQRSLAGKGIRAVKNQSPGGLRSSWLRLEFTRAGTKMKMAFTMILSTLKTTI